MKKERELCCQRAGEKEEEKEEEEEEEEEKKKEKKQKKKKKSLIFDTCASGIQWAEFAGIRIILMANGKMALTPFLSHW